MILLLPLRSAAQPHRAPRMTLAIIAVNLLAFLLSSPRAAQKLAEQEAELARIAEWSLSLPRRENARLDERARRYPSALAFLEKDDLWASEISSAELRERLLACVADYKAIQSNHIFYKYGFVPARISAPRLIAHQFLHADFLHIGFNMLFLWAIGALVEVTLGRWLFLAAYLACGVAAALTHAALNPLSMDPAIGASGAVAGVMGLLAVMHGRRRLRLALVAMVAVAPRIFFFSLPAYMFIVLWLIEQIFFASFGSTTLGVAFAAHLGGFAFGALAALTHRLVFGPALDLDLDSEE
jgi:membrane associated rhomboid family serine protease